MTALLWSVGSVGYIAMAVLVGGWRWGTYPENHRSLDDRWPSAFFGGAFWPIGGLLFLAGAHGERIRRKRQAIDAQEREVARLLKELQ